MTWNDFMSQMLAAFPNATVDEDNDGQLVIYTDLRLDPANPLEVIPFEEGE